jgi:hypothetical protein
MAIRTPGIVIVKRPTRLQGLRERWGTVGQAKFLLGRAHAIAAAARPAKQSNTDVGSTVFAEASFDEYQSEDDTYQRVLETLERQLDFGVPVSTIDRHLVPTMDFWNTAVVVVVGQDGLVANTAKYVNGLPIVGVNPDPSRFDGVLLPFKVNEARRAVGEVLEHRFKHRTVTLAEAKLNDGQKLLAFNDFFVGRNNHTSARYTLFANHSAEAQSSSGILVSTGAGSTGWMSSVFNMAAGVARMLGGNCEDRVALNWEDRRLLWAVREPFISQRSHASLIAGAIDEREQLRVESLMPDGGLIFSDGVDSDFLPFNTGSIVEIGVSEQVARLVVA